MQALIQQAKEQDQSLEALKNDCGINYAKVNAEC